MGGPAEFRASTAPVDLIEHAFDAAQAEVERLETRYSRYLDTSLVTRINRSAGSGQSIPVDTETAALINYADTLFSQSNGLFDITSGVLRQAWDFQASAPPPADKIAECRARIGWDQVQWDGESIALPRAGMEIDFGGIVKEYACDAAAAVLKRNGLDHALVDLAGDIACTGPEHKAHPWRIGVCQPGDPDQPLATIGLAAGGLATSGDYQRCIEWQGQRYSHILNPLTGWPAQGLVSVTVLADQCLVAGSTSTLALLMSADSGLQWLADTGLPWLAVEGDGIVHGTIAEHHTGSAKL